MKDIIEGVKVVVVLAAVMLAFESSTILGVLSLFGVALLLYISAKKKVYIENPHLRPWLDYKKFEEEQKQIKSKPEENHCGNCGVETPRNSRFCINCGSKNLK